jgi:hypothetical protein
MLRLDDGASLTLQELVERFHVSRADIIRQRMAQANLEDFPTSWHLRAAERRAHQARRVQHGVDHET